MNEPFSLDITKPAEQMTLEDPSFLKASDGIKLAYYPFLLNKPAEKVLIFYHGGGAYQSHYYQYMARQLQENHNIASYLIDIRGHGRSEGPRGDAPSPEQVWHDVQVAIDFVSHKHKGAKIYLGGHSAGCGLLLNYARYKKPDGIAGYIFIAPYLGPEADTKREGGPSRTNKFSRRVLWWPFFLNSISGGLLCRHTYAVTFSYPEKTLKQRPLLITRYTVSMACAVAPHNASKAIAALRGRVHVVIGENDELFDPVKVVSLFDERATSVIVPGARHISILLEAAVVIAQWF